MVESSQNRDDLEIEGLLEDGRLRPNAHTSFEILFIHVKHHIAEFHSAQKSRCSPRQ